MPARSPVDLKATATIMGLCAIWGLQQVVIKAAALSMAPILQVSIRSAIAALVVGVIVLVRGERPTLFASAWRPGLLVGILFALECLFVGGGLRFTSASHMAIFLYTAPIFAALGLHLRVPEERLTALQWGGIGLAFAGIVVAFAGRGAEPGGDRQWIGDLLGIAGGASWGATTLSVRFSRLSNAPATVTLLFQLVVAAALLAAVAALLEQTAVTPTPILTGSLVFQVVFVSLVGFLTWFALLRRYLATQLGVLSFMTPVFGVAFGVLLLGERLDAAFIAGAILVIVGILLVSGRQFLTVRR